MTNRLRLAALLLVLSACGGGDSTGPAPSYDNIAGSYAGRMAGVSQGVVLDAGFSISITQSSGSLSGSYSVSGTLTEGIDVVPVQGSGTLSGTIATGNNPSVNITAMGLCNSAPQFSGAYDSANRRLTISGTFNVFNATTCSVVLSYPMTIILSR